MVFDPLSTPMEKCWAGREAGVAAVVASWSCGKAVILHSNNTPRANIDEKMGSRMGATNGFTQNNQRGEEEASKDYVGHTTANLEVPLLNTSENGKK